MAVRSPEDVLAGVLRISVGGVEKIVPTLPIRATREWQARALDDKTAPAVEAEGAGIANLAYDTVLDIVLTYDRTNALGGREWLEENADPAQLYAAAQQMAEVAFPFVEDVKLLLGARIASVVASARPSFTNGHSPTGASTRRRSRPALTTAS